LPEKGKTFLGLFAEQHFTPGVAGIGGEGVIVGLIFFGLLAGC